MTRHRYAGFDNSGQDICPNHRHQPIRCASSKRENRCAVNAEVKDAIRRADLAARACTLCHRKPEPKAMKSSKSSHAISTSNSRPMKRNI